MFSALEGQTGRAMLCTVVYCWEGPGGAEEKKEELFSARFLFNFCEQASKIRTPTSFSG